jgi:hypothetical protein
VWLFLYIVIYWWGSLTCVVQGYVFLRA